jgi:hypothetical protein
MEDLYVHGNRKARQPDFPDGLMFAAKLFSYLLHPLFLPVLVTFMAVTALPEYFTAFKAASLRLPYDVLYFRVALNTLVFPMLVVLLCTALGFVSSVHMATQRDRIIPYVATIIFYFWAFYTFFREGAAPGFFTSFFLGIFITASVCLVANNFIKISMHTTYDRLGWRYRFFSCADVGVGTKCVAAIGGNISIYGHCGYLPARTFRPHHLGSVYRSVYRCVGPVSSLVDYRLSLP